jgi:hypothetical protein
MMPSSDAVGQRVTAVSRESLLQTRWAHVYQRHETEEAEQNDQVVASRWPDAVSFQDHAISWLDFAEAEPGPGAGKKTRGD